MKVTLSVVSPYNRIVFYRVSSTSSSNTPSNTPINTITHTSSATTSNTTSHTSSNTSLTHPCSSLYHVDRTNTDDPRRVRRLTMEAHDMMYAIAGMTLHTAGNILFSSSLSVIPFSCNHSFFPCHFFLPFSNPFPILLHVPSSPSLVTPSIIPSLTVVTSNIISTFITRIISCHHPLNPFSHSPSPNSPAFSSYVRYFRNGHRSTHVTSCTHFTTNFW